MGLDYLSFVGSFPVSLQIGSARKDFYIHEALIKQHFETLYDAYIKSRCNEREIFEDVEEDTFVRFVEFAYTGSYSVPHPAALPAMNENDDGRRAPAEPDTVPYPDETSLQAGTGAVPLDEPIAEAPSITEDCAIAEPPAPTAEEVTEFPSEISWNGWSSKKMKKKRKQFTDYHPFPESLPLEEPSIGESRGATTKKETLWNSFTSRARLKALSPWEPDTSPDADLDFSPVLLSHARLYVFADRFKTSPLRQLTLDRLRLTLSRFDLFSERTDAIVGLLEYTYKKTEDSEDDLDKLRELVIDYVACHVENLTENRAFLHLLQEPGSLCKDLMLKVLQRLD
ncbi:uncharacterized protein A1O9_00708 [Exophiala aquamarina CBS 119918]|uniref:BTB domain-containing protein n=1 Tax=Exophiala aquamarina CBS 119918 TaxID=1182545 RepID=A0A072Q4A6_9EURO|nr:uncharacterized protein A1O9_00708 [Exophiala aquamarina CBS 119918]KEF62735.1 hypothetical protein A1O9_00708 [Exophiala aquamarina CBS 119918]